MTDCATCADKNRIIVLQRNLMLDLANKHQINLNTLSGSTAEDEWAALEAELRVKLKVADNGVRRRRRSNG